MVSQIVRLNGDGSTDQPTQRDEQLFERARALLAADPSFQAMPAPVTVRAEVNVGIPENRVGYMYTVLSPSEGVPKEVWCNWGTSDQVAFKRGRVRVKDTK